METSHLRPLVLSLLMLGGCGGGDHLILPGDGAPAAIDVVQGDGQSGRVGEPLADPVVVEVTDARGRPVEGASVAFDFSDAGSGADVIPATTETNSEGLADARLVLGRSAGQQTGQARVVTGAGRPPLATTFSATAFSENANSMVAVAGEDQTGHVGQALDDRLVVEVTDGFGNPVRRVPISWSVEGGGSVSETTVETGDDGRARVERILGPAVGRQTTVATSEGLAGSPVMFVHTAIAGNASRLVIVSGNEQTAAAGSALPGELVVRLVDADGNGVSRAGLTWVVATGGGTAIPGNTATDDDGRASTRWTLGETLGEQRIDAVVSGTGFISFKATATAGAPAALFIKTQPSSSAGNGVPFGRQPEIQLRDARGNEVGLAGVQVRASLSPGGAGGELGGTLVMSTGPDGRATFTDLAISGDAGKRTLFFTAEGYAGVTSNEIDVGPPPPENRPPIANFNWFCQGLTCAFTDSSRDPDGSIVSRVWDFGDGNSTSGELTPSHAYATAGVYLVTLTVTDNGGLSAVSEDNAAPQAQSLRIGRDPSGSADMGVPFERQPELELRAGGGALGRAGVVITASVASGAGTLGGTTTATTDDQGRAGFTDLRISGAAGPHTLRFTASGFGEVVSSTIEVRRAGSTTTITGDAPDPSIAGSVVTVDFAVTSGVGTTPTGTATVSVTGSNPPPPCTVTLSNGAGTCEFTLNAVGDREFTATYSGDGLHDGSSDQEPHRVDPVPPPPNQPPTADFTPTSCTTGQSCEFTDTGSSDDGTIVAWMWDFGDPGSPDNSSSSQIATHVFSVATPYNVTLTVTDDVGAQGSITKSVQVNEPAPAGVRTLNLRSQPASTTTDGARLNPRPESVSSLTLVLIAPGYIPVGSQPTFIEE